MKRFLRDDSGATAIEYALIATLISIAIIASVTAIGSNIKTLFFDEVASGFVSTR